MTEEINLPK